MRYLIALILLILLLTGLVTSNGEHDHADQSFGDDLYDALDQPGIKGVLFMTTVIALTSIYFLFRNLREVYRNG